MRKIILIFSAIILTMQSVYASSVDKVISFLHINKGAVTVSVRDVNNGNVVYSLNPNTPMTPASTLKLVTFASAVDTLGFDYEFLTKLYKSTNNDLYFVLSGDPLLKTSDLEALLATAKEKNILTPKNIYIDDLLFDSNDWGEGWQWDDDLNPSMPKFGIYNLDSNLLKIEISPNGASTTPIIAVKPFYPLTFMNNVTTDLTSNVKNIKFTHNNNIPNVIDVSGTVSGALIKYLPVPNLKRYFILRLENAISSSKIEYFNKIKNAQLPDKNVYLVDEVSHEMKDIANLVLKNSNNMAAETVFKAGGAVWAGSQGTIENSLNMLNKYLSDIGLDPKSVTIVDGSGVSKNNLVTADFMTKFLKAEYGTENFEDYHNAMVSPGEGTLKDRMLYFKDNLKAKTGTLSGISAIAGYITTRKGHVLAFDIMVNDSKASDYDKKNLEEQILRQIYMNY